MIKAKELLEKINSDFVENCETLQDHTVYSGSCGICFYLAHLLHNARSKDAPLVDLLNAHISNAVEIISSLDHPLIGLMNGIAGYGLTLSQLNKRNFIDDVAVFEVIDSLFDSLLDKEVNQYSYGQGWSGVGVYYLNRDLQVTDNAYGIFKRLLSKIQDDAKEINGRICWEDYVMLSRENDHNTVTMGHGTPGVLSFLLKAKKQYPFLLKDKVFFERILIDILSLRNSKPDYSLYPFCSIRPNENSRTSWMEGDFSVAVALLHFYRLWPENWVIQELQRIGRFHFDNFEKILSRQLAFSSAFLDISLTSGSCGLYSTCKQIFQSTDLQVFKKLGQLWLAKTWNSYSPTPDNLPGYYNVKPESEFKRISKEKDFGLMNGYAGLGLFCLTYRQKASPINDILVL